MPSGKTIHLPLLGNVPKGAALAGGGAAVVVTGYLIYRHQKASTLDTAYGYGASSYGYGAASAFYGYGSEYASGATGGGSFNPYPIGAEYGYGAYGYGYYNPYTGQYIGPTQQQPPPVSGGGGGGGGGGTKHKKGKWITIGGKKYYFNPNKDTLGHYVGKGKHRHWVKIKG